MSIDNELSAEQYLELESICDQFEEDLRAGCAVPIDRYVRQGSELIQATLRQELDAVYQEFIQTQPSHSTGHASRNQPSPANGSCGNCANQGNQRSRGSLTDAESVSNAVGETKATSDAFFGADDFQIANPTPPQLTTAPNLAEPSNPAGDPRTPFNTVNVRMLAGDRIVTSRNSDWASRIHSNQITLPEQITIGCSNHYADRQKELFEQSGRFQLNAILGQGGAATVWKAFDVELQRAVAVKLPNPSTVSDASRFVREVKATAALSHPNIVTLFDAGLINGQCFMVNELIEGPTLSDVIDHQPMQEQRAASITLAITEAIEHSHQCEIIHRDLKPHNVLIDETGSPKVTDFGLAKQLGHEKSLTGDGDLIGTPAYMAPEQAAGDGRESDKRTDIYGIGAILYQLLTGRAPFRGSFERVIFQVVHAPTPRIREVNPTVSASLAAICEKCLEKSPDLRFQSASELAQELRRFLHGDDVETRTVSLLGRYRRWLTREPRLALACTFVVGLLFVIATGASLAAWSLDLARRDALAAQSIAETAQQEESKAKRQESQARRQAELAKEIAQRNEQLAKLHAGEARQTADFFASFLEPPDLLGINRTINSTIKAKILSPEVIEAANENAESLLAGRPASLARIKGVLGNAYRGQGEFGKAKQLLDEARKLLQDRNPDAQVHASDLAMLDLYQALLLQHQGDDEAAKTLLASAVTQHHKSIKQHGATELGELQLAQAQFELAALLMMNERDNARALPLLESALRIRQRLLKPDDKLLLLNHLVLAQAKARDGESLVQHLPPNLIFQVNDEASRAIWRYTEVLKERDQGRHEQSIAQYESLLPMLENLLGKRNRIYLLATGELASIHWKSGNLRKAEPLIEYSIEQAMQIAPRNQQLQSAQRQYAFELYLAKRFDEAKRQLLASAQANQPSSDQTADGGSDAVKPVQGSTTWTDEETLSLIPQLHPDALVALTLCCLELEEPELALAASEQLLDLDQQMAVQIAWHQFTKSLALQKLGRTSEAAQWLQDANATASQANPGGSPTWIARMGQIFEAARDPGNAERLYRQAIACATKKYHAGHPRTAVEQVRLARVLINQGNQRTDSPLPDDSSSTPARKSGLSQKRIEARRLLGVALKTYVSNLPKQDRRTAEVRSLLATEFPAR